MPKIDISRATVRTGSSYPAAFQHVVQGREKRALGTLAGLTQFGVNITRLKPKAASALRHWHESEDEFVYVLEGELVLVDNAGETVMKAGDAAGFRAGEPNGHHLVNKSNSDAVYLEIGTRAPVGRAHSRTTTSSAKRMSGAGSSNTSPASPTETMRSRP